MWMNYKVWMIGHNGSYRHKFEDFIKTSYYPEEVEKFIKTPNFYKCYFKNGDYLYGSNFDILSERGLRFDAIFIESYIYWIILNSEDREHLSFNVTDSKNIIVY